MKLEIIQFFIRLTSGQVQLWIREQFRLDRFFFRFLSFFLQSAINFITFQNLCQLYTSVVFNFRNLWASDSQLKGRGILWLISWFFSERNTNKYMDEPIDEIFAKNFSKSWFLHHCLKNILKLFVRYARDCFYYLKIVGVRESQDSDFFLVDTFFSLLSLIVGYTNTQA